MKSVPLIRLRMSSIVRVIARWCVRSIFHALPSDRRFVNGVKSLLLQTSPDFFWFIHRLLATELSSMPKSITPGDSGNDIFDIFVDNIAVEDCKKLFQVARARQFNGVGERTIYFLLSDAVCVEGRRELTSGLLSRLLLLGEKVSLVAWSASDKKFVVAGQGELVQFGFEPLKEPFLAYSLASDHKLALEEDTVCAGDWLCIPELMMREAAPLPQCRRFVGEARRLGLKTAITFGGVEESSIGDTEEKKRRYVESVLDLSLVVNCISFESEDARKRVSEALPFLENTWIAQLPEKTPLKDDGVVDVRQGAFPIDVREEEIGKIFYWVDKTIEFPANTGIQRIVRGLASALLDLGYELVPVKWDRKNSCLRVPTELELKFLNKWGGPDPQIWSKNLDIDLGNKSDWLLIPELTSYLPIDTLSIVKGKMAELGVRTASIFHDAIPFKHQDIYPKGASTAHESYMESLLDYDLVFPNSAFSSNDLIKFFMKRGIRLAGRAQKFRVCELPGEFQKVNRRTTHKLLSAKKVKVLCVGTVEPRKNHLRLLEAFSIVTKQVTQKIELIVVGGNPYFDLSAKVKDQIEKVSNVEWRHNVDDEELQCLYDDCDFTIFPSIDEGYGLPIVESLWNAKPCICSNEGAIGDLARAGGCLAVDVVDVSDIANGIMRLATDQELRRRLASEAIGREFKTWHEYGEEIAAQMAMAGANDTIATDNGLPSNVIKRHFAYQEGVSRPILSICISTYNRSDWLAVSLKNLFTILPNVSDEIEVVVTDNASTDNTGEIVKPYQARQDFRYRRNDQNVGMLGNLEETVFNSRGKYVWVLGDDDIIRSGTIERILAVIQDQSDLSLIYLNYSYSREDSPKIQDDIARYVHSAVPLTCETPDEVAKVRCLATKSENFFTGIYSLVLRRDHAIRAYSTITDGIPFSSLPTCIPTTHYVLNHMMEENGCWLGGSQLVVNMNVSWKRYAAVWILERLPEAFELAEVMGANATEVDHWRRNLLPSVDLYLNEFLGGVEFDFDTTVSVAGVSAQFCHLPEFRALAAEAQLSLSTGRGGEKRG